MNNAIMACSLCTPRVRAVNCVLSFVNAFLKIHARLEEAMVHGGLSRKARGL